MTAVTVTAGTVKIGRNTFPATRDEEGTVTYVTSKGEKFATAKVAKSFTPNEIKADLTKLENEAAKPIARIASGPDTRPVNEAKVAKQEAKAEAPKPAAKPKAPAVIVTDEDLTLLVYVAAHQKSPKFRHLDHCPHFEKDAKFVKADDAKLASLKPCPDCSRNAARTRVAN